MKIKKTLEIQRSCYLLIETRKSPPFLMDNGQWIMDNYPLSIVHYPLIKKIALVFCLFFIFGLLSSQITAEYEEYLHFELYSEREERVVPFIQRELAKGIVNFQYEMRSFPDIDVTIHIAPNREMYQDWVTERNIKLPNTMGFADLNNNNIYIQNPRYIRGNRQLIDLLLHEYIHIFVHHHFNDAPLWFHEGMAWYYSTSISLNQTFQFMSNNAFNSNYLLIRYSYNYPENTANIEPFYFQSAMLLRKINEEYRNQLFSLIDFGAQGQSFTEAFMNSFFMTDIEFLNIFESDLQVFFKMNVYKGLILLTWLSFPIFLIIARIKKNRRTREILAQWEIEEANGIQNSEFGVRNLE